MKFVKSHLILRIQTHQNKPYCKTHCPKVFHTQVASVEMQNAMKPPKAARAVKGINRARGTFAPGYYEGGYDEGGYYEGGYDEGGYYEGGYDEGGY